MVDEAWLAAHVVEDLRLLMVERVVLSNVRVIVEGHKRAVAVA